MKKRILLLLSCFPFVLQAQQDNTTEVSQLFFQNTLDSITLLKPLPNNSVEDEYGILRWDGTSEAHQIEFLYVTSKKMQGEKLKRNKVRSKSTVYNLARAVWDTLNQIMVADELLFELNTNVQEGPAAFDPKNKIVYFTRNMGKMGTNQEYQLNIFQTPYPPVAGKRDQFPIFEIDGNYSNMHPSFDAKNQTLYFSSDRPGGFGGMDIYRVRVNSDGRFGEAQNLGAAINTASDEVFPYVYREDVVFFSRKRKEESGALDVMMGQKEADEWISRALGAPFLSDADDFSFSIDPNTKLGFLSSNRSDGVGKDDNYYFLYRPQLKGVEDSYSFTQDTLFVDAEGVLENDQVLMLSEDPLQAIIDKTVILEEKTANGSLQLNSDGSFYYLVSNPLILEDQFSYRLQSEFNTSAPIRVTLKGSEAVQTKREAINFNLRPIYYKFNESELWTVYQDRFDEVVAVLDQYPELKLIIKAYTDARGSAAYNQKLSEERAASIKNYLVAHIKNNNSIESVGYGETTIENNTLKNYLLVGGSFEKEENTSSIMKSYRDMGYSPRMQKDSGGLTRLIVETFDFYAEAKQARLELEEKNLSTWIQKSPVIQISEEAHQFNRRVEFEVVVME